jgi:transposase
LRLRHDLLAPAEGLATPRRLGETPARPAPAGRAGGGHRLGALLRGQPELPRRFWGVLTGKNPTDRAKKGTKRHLLVDGKGTPLAVRITGANRNESLEAMNLMDDIPPIRGRRGRPRRKPKALYGDRQYGTPRNHQGLKERRIEDHLAQQRTPHGSGLGKVRWVVESTLSWVGQARRLKIRYERLPAMHRAFHYLRLAQICCKVLQRDF